ncbi:putative lantibiotic resistance protein [Mammaliicoccus stepanovicii]|uniref:Putative lantibiotic resistance protein n=2 Tax=Mammaliicoccus stepanovicii TaxID=643214 RepID=A0A239ZKE0_9STAP|nr:YdcF family protein [Mammaliicoccus stepanovicii]SNV71742.1 putative lantibiotic resistance protein [Mammaliicoccus stepanovicii]
MMVVTLALLILFVISFKIDYRQYKNVFLLCMLFISIFILLVRSIAIPVLSIHLNINYLLITNIVYGLIVIVAMLLSLLNTKKKMANEGRFMTNMIVLGYGAFIFLNFIIILFKPEIIVTLGNGIIPIYISFIFYYLNLMFISHNIYAWLISAISKRKKSQYIIVLGAGIIGDKVTPLLKARLDKAIKLQRKNKNTKIIVSGGQGDDEIISEAEAMKQYLLNNGVLNETIIKEEKSTNTEENLIYSYRIMEKMDAHPFSIIVSNHFHILRAGLISKKLKMKATVTGGSSKKYFYPNAYVREFIAILYMYIMTHTVIIILLSIMLFMYVLSL